MIHRDLMKTLALSLLALLVAHAPSGAQSPISVPAPGNPADIQANMRKLFWVSYDTKRSTLSLFTLDAARIWWSDNGKESPVVHGVTNNHLFTIKTRPGLLIKIQTGDQYFKGDRNGMQIWPETPTMHYDKPTPLDLKLQTTGG